MRRVLTIALAAGLVALSGSPAVAWRATPASGWDALDAALAPVNVDVAGYSDVFYADLMALNDAAASVYLNAPVHIDNIESAQAEVSAAIAKVRESAGLLQGAANAGLDILAAAPIEPCFAQYAYVEGAAFLLYGDAAESVLVSDPAQLGGQWASAQFLFDIQAPLEYAAVTCP